MNFDDMFGWQEMFCGIYEKRNRPKDRIDLARRTIEEIRDVRKALKDPRIGISDAEEQLSDCLSLTCSLASELHVNLDDAGRALSKSQGDSKISLDDLQKLVAGSTSNGADKDAQALLNEMEDCVYELRHERPAEKNSELLNGEFGQILSSLAAVSNALGISLARAAGKTYANHCKVCGKQECVCRELCAFTFGVKELYGVPDGEFRRKVWNAIPDEIAMPSSRPETDITSTWGCDVFGTDNGLLQSELVDARRADTGFIAIECAYGNSFRLDTRLHIRLIDLAKYLGSNLLVLFHESVLDSWSRSGDEWVQKLSAYGARDTTFNGDLLRTVQAAYLRISTGMSLEPAFQQPVQMPQQETNPQSVDRHQKLTEEVLEELRRSGYTFQSHIPLVAGKREIDVWSRVIKTSKDATEGVLLRIVGSAVGDRELKDFFTDVVDVAETRDDLRKFGTLRFEAILACPDVTRDLRSRFDEEAKNLPERFNNISRFCLYGSGEIHFTDLVSRFGGNG